MNFWLGFCVTFAQAQTNTMFSKLQTLGLIISLISASFSLSAQNELFINGDNVLNISSPELYIDSSDGVNPTLFVNGEIVIKNGQFVNDSSELELTGNFTNNTNGVTAMYESTGTERFSGDTNSIISGTWNDTTGNINQFHYLKIKKANNRNYVQLQDEVFVHKSGKLEFEENGIVVTDTIHSSDGADYKNILYIQNPDEQAIIGHSTGNGAINNYIEGKLKREIDSGNYYFPIGVDTASIDGMESFELRARTGFKSGVLAYVKEEASTNLPSTITTYADLGTHPGGPSTGLDFSNDLGNCTTGDGITDRVNLTVGQSHSWIISPDSASTYDYDVEFYPGVQLEASQSFYTCGSLELGYILKDGVPNGDNTTTGQGLPTFTATGYITNPNNSNSLTNQNSFSTFRKAGAVISGTTLPVELVSLTAYGINNKHINVEWLTATEINNSGFELQRSINGIDFNTIAWITGAGNSSEVQNYSYTDTEVSTEIVYYYRLNQIDFDGKNEHSITVSASLKKSDIFTVNVFPNPVNVIQELIVEINSPLETKANVKVYDALGKLIILDQLNLNKGINSYRLQNNVFAAGQYFIVVNMANEQFSKNVLVKE